MEQTKRSWHKGISLFLVTVLLVAAFSGSAYAADSENSAKTAKRINYSGYIKDWHNKNSDIQGWLYIDGTNINYPVIFYPEDTLYYNALGYSKEASRNGVIWADNLTLGGSKMNMTQNTVLYGHNWTNVSANPRIGSASDVMFAQLPAFHHLDFAKEHQFINYSTDQDNFVFQVFAVFYTEESFMYNRSTPTAEQFNEMISGARARSLHNFDVDVASGDKLITLSTCTRAFGQSPRQRFVVMGKMVSDGTELATVSANPNYQRPKL